MWPERNSSFYTPLQHAASHSNMFGLSMLSVTFHGRSWALPSASKGKSEIYFQLKHTRILMQKQSLFLWMLFS